MNTSSKRIMLLEIADDRREVLARRLRAQGYAVECVSDPALAAEIALSSPPDVVIADLWMPSISGVQLCRLLRGEPATEQVPVVLRGDDDDPRSRFWAERAGATAYVPKGRIGDLVRTLARAIEAAPSADAFFMQLSGGSVDIRDRIARHLDSALFDSVIASEVRALAACGSFERLFDALSQFLSQLIGYRWLALSTIGPDRAAIHHHPRWSRESATEARVALELEDEIEFHVIDDEDARGGTDPAAQPVVRPIRFGDRIVGRLVVAPMETGNETQRLLTLIACELGAAVRMTALVEESARLASLDPLTGAMNRRAFGGTLKLEVERMRRYGTPLSLLLLDVDHFKSVNDTHGHAAGDAVLVQLARILKRHVRALDAFARWGGEEFIVALPSTPADGAFVAAERIRAAVESEPIRDPRGVAVSVTVSVGVAEFRPDDSIERLVERADVAMYRAKSSGRNRVVSATSSRSLVPHSVESASRVDARGA